MRTSRILPLAAALLVGCDQQGTLPTDTTKIDTKMGSTGSTAGGATGSTGDTSGTGADTASDGLAVYDSTKLLGPVTLTGGTRREALFYFAQDRSLHILASSDGAPGQSTVGRETIWDIQITSPDSTAPSFVSRSNDPGLSDTLSYYWDLSNPSVPLYAIHFRLKTISGAPEVRVAAASKALLTISVVAHSGIDDNTVGWTPPLLPDDTTAGLIKLGLNQVSVAKSTFEIRMSKVD